MASTGTLQQAVTDIRVNGYSNLITIVTVGYDYILTFSEEIEYIWLVAEQAMDAYVYIIRSGSVFWLVLCDSCLGEFLLTWQCKGAILLDFANWTSFIFFVAADLTMILRVWALYGRSRIIIGTLLTFNAIVIIPYLIYCIWMTVINKSTPDIGHWQVLDVQVTFCTPRDMFSIPLTYIFTSAQILFGILMCLLLVIQFIREALQMYRVTKQFRLNRYMNLLLREGMVYFAINLGYAIVNFLMTTGSIPSDTWHISMAIATMQIIPPFTLIPRFILSLRKLYAHDLRGRCGSNGIDIAFGLTSVSAAMNSIVFVDMGHNEGEEQIDAEVEEIQLEERDIRDTRRGGKSARESAPSIGSGTRDSEQGGEIQLEDREIGGASSSTSA